MVFQAAKSPPIARSRVAPLAVALFAILSALTAARAEEYQLGPMDKLKIRVVEWQTAEGSVRDWSMISGDYVVGPSGNVSMPFIGEMPAAGRTTAEIAVEIGDKLQQKFGLLDRPEASVELAEFRPVFVSGEVQTPGRYPYEPGLTVLKAVSLASGLERSSDGLRIERDFINARGQYDVLVAERNRLHARFARLKAEAEGKDTIEMPKELAELPEGKSLLADEAAMMEARRRTLDVQIKTIEDLKQLLRNEIESLEKKIATQNRQVELARKELESIGGLKEQGLVRNERILNTERTIAELEGKILDMETAALKAKQDISKAEQDAITLRNDRETEIGQQRQETEALIEGVNLKIAMYQDLMAEAVSLAPEAAARSNEEARQTVYQIVRTVDGKSQEIAADENTPVLPGDIVKVDIVLSETGAVPGQ